MTAPSIPQDDADSIDLDVLLALTEKYGLENAAQWQQTYSRLHMVSFDGLNIDNLEENVAIELVQLLRALPRLIRYAKKIKDAAFFGPFNASIPQTRTTPLDPDLHKRYWLFTWHEYEARGGLSDFNNAFDTVEEARQSTMSRNDLRNLEGDIIDSQTGFAMFSLFGGTWKANE